MGYWFGRHENGSSRRPKSPPVLAGLGSTVSGLMGGGGKAQFDTQTRCIGPIPTRGCLVRPGDHCGGSPGDLLRRGQASVSIAVLGIDASGEAPASNVASDSLTLSILTMPSVAVALDVFVGASFLHLPGPSYSVLRTEHLQL